MSPRAWDRRICDILDACAEIGAFVEGMTFEQFQTDLRTMRAVELNFIIIGEAVNSIPEDLQEAHPQVAWHLMRAMRNKLVHSYFSTSPQILWDTIHQNLPPVIAVLEKIMEDQG